MKRAGLAAILGVLGVVFGRSDPAAAQLGGAPSTDGWAAARLARMTAAEKVGQLVVVAFYGSTPDPLGDVIDLIGQQHIGGVVLQRTNNVFANRDNPHLPSDIATMTAALQRRALEAGGIPLFVAIDHEGDSLSHLREGFTPLPNAMAIGATWSRAAAQRAGEVAGRELAAVGVNMLLGPVLDVLALPRSDSQGDLGTRVFGGDPYWVGELGRAYIAGVAAGGHGRVLTIAKHFPGHGNSDRLPDQEVAVVSQGIEDLKKIELPPFAAVTSLSTAGRADGLMTSHIQYRGLQGNLRSVTRPLSFDREGLNLLMDLPDEPFGAWRKRGGLLVSDSLGVRAVRRYFDPSDQTFPHREVARSALMAGNDVLTLAEFSQRQAWSVMRRNVSDTLAYLAATYDSDPELRTRVDDAVTRVLMTKHRLYGDWSPAAVVARPEQASSLVGRPADVRWLRDAMRAAATALRAYDRPRTGNRLVIVTDDGRQLACPLGEHCGLSPAELARLSAFGPTLVEGYLLQRYGPDGSGILNPGDLLSLTFCQLRDLLSPANQLPSTPPLDILPTAAADAPLDQCPALADPAAARSALLQADWVVFAYGDLRHDDAQLLNGFLLPEVAGLVGRRGAAHLAVLAFGPPYLIDRTNIERLDAFIVGYSRIPAAIESGVAALFGDPRPSGASPVSVEDAGYDLAKTLSPAPDQTLVARLSPDPATLSTLPATLHLTTDSILDGNGHPVPDGTPVEITSDPPTALALTAGLSPVTRDGRASGELTLISGGRITIHVASPPARDHQPIVFNVPVAAATPQLAPSSASGDGTGPLTSSSALVLPRPSLGLDLVDLLAALSAACVSAAATVWLAGRRRLPSHRQLARGLGAFGGAAVGYLAYAAPQAFVTASGRAGSWLNLGPLAAGAAFAGAVAGSFLAARTADAADARPV